MITVHGKTAFRHTVSNAGAGARRPSQSAITSSRGCARRGHIHGTERIEFEIAGVKTRFNQVSAIIAVPHGAGLSFISGVTLYRVKNGEIDAGRFIPLE